MAFIAKTNSFTSGSTISASQVNANFDDFVNGLSDGTKSIGVDSATFGGAIDANSTLQVAGATTLSSTVRVAGAATFSGAMTVAGTLQCAGALTASSTAQFTGDILGTASFASNVNVRGTTILYGSTLLPSVAQLVTTQPASFGGNAFFEAEIQINGGVDKPVTFLSSVYTNGDLCANTANPYVTTATITGFSGNVTRAMAIYGRGKGRNFYFNVTCDSGVSNRASIMLPTACVNQSSIAFTNPIVCIDASTYTIGYAIVEGGSTELKLWTNAGGGGWTTGATRSVYGTLQYEVA
jgi:hypothetical protein